MQDHYKPQAAAAAASASVASTASTDAAAPVSPALDVAIIGGGIGGLVTALALHAAGIRCTVFESVPALRPLGVGINLLPHSVRVLAALGLQPQLAATAIETAALAFYNRHGQLIWSEPRGIAAGYAYPQFSIHRGELQMLLLAAVRERMGEAAVLTGHALERFVDDGDAVRLHFVDPQGTPRETVRAHAVIAADGIHSVVRRHFHPDEGPPRFSGRLLWRGTCEGAPFLDGRTMIQAGHADQKFVCYPISRQLAVAGRARINWIAELSVAHDTPPRQDWSRRVDASIFREPFAGWRFDWLDVPALIDATDAIYEYPMADRDPLAGWTHGRITLLGDSAHPMYPIGSNGASQSILDAEAMASALVETGFARSGASGDRHPAEGFARYEAMRREATGRIVLGNRAGGPDQVMQIAEERAPGGFAHIHDVIPLAELEAISARYKQLAGFSREQVNRPVAP
jgi:2-polyprenyl-6-methoxyphenol hydroxylase-like FAD-dependent oxidoreductase